MNDTTCPVCREPMQPTRFRPIHTYSGEIARTIGLDYRCRKSCRHRVTHEEWNAAVAAWARETAGQGGGSPATP